MPFIKHTQKNVVLAFYIIRKMKLLVVPDRPITFLDVCFHDNNRSIVGFECANQKDRGTDGPPERHNTGR